MVVRHEDHAASRSEQRAQLKIQHSEATPSPTHAPNYSDPRSIGRLLIEQAGYGSSEFSCLDVLWTRESGWQVHAYNSSSGAYGIPQALPGYKMASAGADWRDNPYTQEKWGLGYIKEQYGTPCGALAHSNSLGWY